MRGCLKGAVVWCFNDSPEWGQWRIGEMQPVPFIYPALLCDPPCRWDVCVEYVPEDDGVDPPMPESPNGGDEQQQRGEGAEP
jgi:hypothetical protein